MESNRKVNLHMLKALGTIIPQMKESLPKVVYVLIPAIVDNHLNSKTNAIYVTALAAIRSVVRNLGEVLMACQASPSFQSFISRSLCLSLC